MKIDTRAIALVSTLIVVGFWIASAGAADCTSQRCPTYLPVVQAVGPTSTPTPTNTPAPTTPDEDMCVTFGPVPAEGAQAWLLDYNLAPGDRTLLCVRFTQDNQAVFGAQVQATARYPDRDRYIGSELTRVGGVLALPFTVSPVSPGQLIVVYVAVTYANQAHGAITQFLSQSVPTRTPTLTPKPTITLTSTPTNTPTPTLTSTPTLTPTP